MNKSNMKQKERKEYLKEVIKFFENTNTRATEKDVEELKVFGEFLTYEYNGINFYALSELFNEDMGASIKLLNTIREFCISKKISLHVAFHFLMIFSKYQLSNLKDLSIEDVTEKANLKNLTKEDINSIQKKLETIRSFSNAVENENMFYTILKNRFSQICEYGKSLPTNDIDMMVYQTVLNDSYDEIKKQVLNNAKDAKLPLDQYDIKPMKVISEIESEQRTFDNLFNSRAVGQMKGDNHFMSYILNDKMVATGKGNVVFKGHTNALSIGYTQKAITLSLEKDKASILRELKTGLRHLKKQTHENIKEVIELQETLIRIIEQTKHKNIVTFKVLAKEMCISKNQVKRYAKQLHELFSINDNTFDTKFDEIVYHDFRNNNS